MNFPSGFDVSSAVFRHEGQVMNFDELKHLVNAAVLTVTAEMG
jgi:hypothetical protein